MQKSTVTIIGGGLAGLTAAIHLAKSGIAVQLFEKETYPHHKVCGEYVSKEILPYFQQLGLNLKELGAVDIQKLQYSTPKGNSLEIPLPLGGLGISRYAFDDYLFRKAVDLRVEVIQEVVKDVEYKNDVFMVETASGARYSARIVLGAFGKRSLLDKKLSRSFFRRKAPWLAVKSHYASKIFPNDRVALHNFKGGYCGLSRTETGAVNVCYLSTYESFKSHKSPEAFKEQVLRRNPFLDRFFSEATPIFDKPLSIAQVSFHQKSLVKEHMLLLGDAGGLLHPLCGNGMAMAIHSAKIASELSLHFLRGNLDRSEIEAQYRTDWNYNFKRRMKTGRRLQAILLNEKLSEISQSVISNIPSLLPQIIKRTHGRPIL